MRGWIARSHSAGVVSLIAWGGPSSDKCLGGEGLLDLKQFILEHRRDKFAYGLTCHMLSYALGRPLDVRDEETILKLQAVFEKSGYKMRSLIKAIVTTDLFRQSTHP